MTPKEYVIHKINELSRSFPEITFTYEHNEVDQTHTIEVLPAHYYSADEYFQTAEHKVYQDFFEKYPHEALYFTTADSLVPLERVSYIKKGQTQNDYVWSDNYISHLSESILVQCSKTTVTKYETAPSCEKSYMAFNIAIVYNDVSDLNPKAKNSAYTNAA